MAEIHRNVAPGSVSTVRNQRKRGLWLIGMAAAIGAAVLAGIFLIPRGDIVKSQLNREVAEANAAGTTPVVVKDGGSGSAQVLAGPNGTTFIIGEPGTLVGLDTSLNDLVNAKDPKAFPEVILIRNAEVQSVPGDQVFAIGNTQAESVIVKIEEPTNPGPSPEHALVVREGQKVAVSGTVEKLPSLTAWGISGYESGKLGNTSIYIRANTVQIMP